MAPKSTRGDEQRARRRELRARLAELREKLRHALAAKKARLRELVRIVRAERLALRERLRSERKRAIAALRAAADAERLAAREDWHRRLRDARASGRSEVERLRAELAAGRSQAAAQRAIDQAARIERAKHNLAHVQQSDDQVRALIPRELVPLFDRVSRAFSGKRAESRAEAFLRYAEENPEAVFKAVELQAHEHVERARADVEDATRAAAVGATVSEYAARRAARIERMRARAAKLKSAADAADAKARAVADRIPMGQPILVGHHSQRRHERDIARIQRSFTKSAELGRDAATLERRAAAAERNTAVSSDDPEAIAKLREKLTRLKADRERMRSANAAIRGGGDVVGALGALGFSEARAKQLLERDFAGRIGFPDYALRNAGAEAARVERRIRELETRAATTVPSDVVIGEARIAEADNRVRVTFPGIPPESVRRALKSAGFKWARSAGAWQRHASNGAWHAAKEVLQRHFASPSSGGSASS